ncbi:MAG: hypothetical protein JSR72_15725 [Proteobacteria bacterium]|nr:hypothetical protein [Pseudomonadota bacterium]
MSRNFAIAALLATTAALTATPTFAATWHHRGDARYQSAWRAENTSDPTEYMVENSIPVQDHHAPGITAAVVPAPAASTAYAYAPASAYPAGHAYASDPTMYAIRNSIPEVYPHVPGFGARP